MDGGSPAHIDQAYAPCVWHRRTALQGRYLCRIYVAWEGKFSEAPGFPSRYTGTEVTGTEIALEESF
jgi:hypothetical protein